MKPTYSLGSQSSELEVTFRQHPQHLGVILGQYHRQSGLT
jgi:hypothetical protein